MSDMIGHLLLAYKWGMKQLYYFQTNDGAGEYEATNPAMDQLAPSQVEDEQCDSCTI